MRTLLAGVVIVGLVALGRADDPDPEKVVQKAVAAHGGDKVLKAKGLYLKGQSWSEDGGAKLVSEHERWLHFPDRVWATSSVAVGTARTEITGAFDGKTGWQKVAGKVKDLDRDAANSLVESVFPDRVMSLKFLRDKPDKLSLVGEVKVNDKPAVGVRVERKGAPDVNLYFDAKTGLLAKAEWRGKDLNGTEVNDERFYKDYKGANGITFPKRVVVHQDGKLRLETEWSEYELLADGVRAEQFAKPKGD